MPCSAMFTRFISLISTRVRNSGLCRSYHENRESVPWELKGPIHCVYIVLKWVYNGMFRQLEKFQIAQLDSSTTAKQINAHSAHTNDNHASIIARKNFWFLFQCLAVSICLGLPYVVLLVASTRDNVYAETQSNNLSKKGVETLLFSVFTVLAEMVFACATLFNSIVIVMRNRIYMTVISSLFSKTCLLKHPKIQKNP